MRRESLVGHVEEIHGLIVDGDRPADQLFRDFFKARRYLGSTDRRFIAETTYALLRYKLRLDRTPGMERVASRIDALERGLPVTGDLAFDESFPPWMIDMFTSRWGAEEAARLARALNRPAPLTLRANTRKCDRESLLRELAREGIEGTPTPRAPQGIRLSKRINIFASRAFLDGKFEVQDEGSQLVSIALDPHPDWKVLDACAGAGGKALHLSNLMRGKGEIFAHEPDPRRREELSKRARRADAQNIRVVDRAAIPPRVDAVLVDAPCSGMGTIRRNPMIKNRLTPEDLLRHQRQQIGILADYARHAPRVLYATCSLAAEENEAVVTTLPGFALASSETLLPHHTATDGFYLASLSC